MGFIIKIKMEILLLKLFKNSLSFIVSLFLHLHSSHLFLLPFCWNDYFFNFWLFNSKNKIVILSHSHVKLFNEIWIRDKFKWVIRLLAFDRTWGLKMRFGDLLRSIIEVFNDWAWSCNVSWRSSDDWACVIIFLLLVMLFYSFLDIIINVHVNLNIWIILLIFLPQLLLYDLILSENQLLKFLILLYHLVIFCLWNKLRLILSCNWLSLSSNLLIDLWKLLRVVLLIDPAFWRIKSSSILLVLFKHFMRNFSWLVVFFFLYGKILRMN